MAQRAAIGLKALAENTHKRMACLVEDQFGMIQNENKTRLRIVNHQAKNRDSNQKPDQSLCSCPGTSSHGLYALTALSILSCVGLCIRRVSVSLLVHWLLAVCIFECVTLSFFAFGICISLAPILDKVGK